MSLLTIVRTFCQRTGLSAPASVMASTDAQVIQIKALLDEICEDLCDRWTWSALIKEAGFVTIAGEDQGTITGKAQFGFSRILNETIFNRTTRLPLYGPLNASKWQELKALPNSGPFYMYRIRGNKLLFNPPGVAGQNCFFEYVSTYCILAVDGVTQKAVFSVDTDTCLLDEKLLQAGLRWRWKAEKGLDYAEELRRYEEMATNASGRDGTKRRLDMGVDCSDFRPGIWVPSGNWNVS